MYWGNGLDILSKKLNSTKKKKQVSYNGGGLWGERETIV